MGLGGEIGLTEESVWVGPFHQFEQMDNEKRIKMKITSNNKPEYILSFLSTFGVLSHVLPMYIEHDWILGWFKNKQNQLC